MPPIDLNLLPDDASTLRKMVGELVAQLQHESAEKDKYRSLLRELLEAQRNRKSEQLSKEQLALFEELWKAQQAEDQSGAPGYKPIDLIDGERLVELLVEHRLGIKDVTIVDHEFFTPFQ